MPRKLVAAILTVTIASAFSFTASAEPSAEDAFKYRASLMTVLRGHIGAASMIVRGLVEDDGHLIEHAEGLANGVAELHRVFQEGSVVDDSEALPAIWAQPEKFAAALDAAEKASENFLTVVADGGDAGAAFRDLGKTCGGCHDDFRVAH